MSDLNSQTMQNCVSPLSSYGSYSTAPSYLVPIVGEAARESRRHEVVMKVLEHKLAVSTAEEAARVAKAAADILYPPPPEKKA